MGRDKRKKKGRNYGKKKARSFQYLKPISPKRKVKRTFQSFENLGMSVDWIDGKVYIHRNGSTEVYNSFSELRVPSRVAEKTEIQLPEPNALFFEKNGVMYYIFENIGVTVKSTLTYWPDQTDIQPPVHLFCKADNEEVVRVLKEIEKKRWKAKTERAIKMAENIMWRKRVRTALKRAREIKWRSDVRAAVRRAEKIVARKYGLPESVVKLPVSVETITDLKCKFDVKVKV